MEAPSGMFKAQALEELSLDEFRLVGTRGFPKIMGTFLVVPTIRTTVFWGLYWGPLFRETTITWQSLSEQLGASALEQ